MLAMNDLPLLYRIEDLAQAFGISRSKAYTLKLRDGWPSTEFGSKSFRFTAEQVAQITAIYVKTPQQPTKRAPRIGTRAKKNQ